MHKKGTNNHYSKKNCLPLCPIDNKMSSNERKLDTK